MIRYLIGLLAVLTLGACTAAPAPAPAPRETVADPRTVQVLILGTYHFGNPGLDVANVAADDVLSPRRQAELEALEASLASFRPTAIAVESTRRGDDLRSVGYQTFQPEDLATSRNETVQIGYRLANRLSLDRVYAIDESEGEIAFFPFDRVQALAEQTGRSDLVESVITNIQKDIAEFEAAQASETISQLLARYNDPEAIRRQHDDFYYRLFAVSDGDDHAGAALNYGWYARNALIFSNLVRVAEPGDRIVVVYGAGHAYWLRHLVEETPGFTLVEATDYLR